MSNQSLPTIAMSSVSSLRILIIDADSVDTMLMERALKVGASVEILVDTVSSFQDGLARLPTNIYDVILLDLRMPGGSGIERLIEIQAVSPRQIVIMVSASDDLQTSLEYLEAGAHDFIQKSELTVERFVRSVAHSRIREALGRKLETSLADAQELAERDALTGLANRHLFDSTLKVCLTNNRSQTTSLALFIFDLDRFKFVNDSFGHVVGDRLLKLFAERVLKLLRPDEMFARLGGDEFALLVSNLTDDSPVTLIANRILQGLQEPFVIDSHILPVTTSIGIAISPENGENAADILKHADIAMYRAKKNGRNTFCFFSDDMQHHYREQQTTELKLRQSIDSDQFLLHFQPIVRCGMHGIMNSIIGAEALIRWCEDGTTMRMPDRFLAVAEDTGLMGQIGEWVLREAIARLADIRQTLPAQERDGFCMSINVSPTQLTDDTVVSVLTELLHHYSIPASCIEIELTETAFVEEAGLIETRIWAIAELGCRIALDDFGTGFSSIAHLQRFPISTVKIDRCLMPVASADIAAPSADLLELPHEAQPARNSRLAEQNQYLRTLALLKGLLAMLHSLELTTTAEGVETDEQQKLCLQMGATRLQGWYYSKALPFVEFMALLKKSSSEES